MVFAGAQIIGIVAVNLGNTPLADHGHRQVGTGDDLPGVGQIKTVFGHMKMGDKTGGIAVGGGLFQELFSHDD